MSPAAFGMVMATGIVAIAAQLLGLPLVARSLFGLSVVMYVVLWLLTLLRVLRHRQRFVGDLFDHLRGPGFFTVVAATSLLGSQFLLLAAHDAHPFAPLLHHYELSTWILYARAYLPEALDPVPEIRALDVMLRRSKNPLSWLLTNWGTNTWPTT